MFSAAEVIPLTFLTVEAWSFLQLGARQESRSQTPFPHRWAVMFLVAVGFWNFLGAGVFGFLINLPIVSYYEIGTSLTANHGHAAMMGVYGMLAVGLALFCLRYLIPAERWPERAAKWSFWSLNIGLAWMCFSDLLPLGFLQLYESVSSSYFHARSLEFLTNSTNTLLEWLRFPGDVLFIAGGVLPLLYICWLGVRHRVGKGTLEEPEEILFTEITEPDARGDRGGSAVSAEALLAAAYAALLAAGGLVLDRLARHTHERSGRFRTNGFSFRAELDAWECPEGEYLHRIDLDHTARVVRYRARAAVCNACPAKDGCTDSDEGREVTPRARSLAALGVGSLPPGDLLGHGRPRGACLPGRDAAKHRARRAGGAGKLPRGAGPARSPARKSSAAIRIRLPEPHAQTRAGG